MATIHKIPWAVDAYLQNIPKVIQDLRLTDLDIEQFQHEQSRTQANTTNERTQEIQTNVLQEL